MTVRIELPGKPENLNALSHNSHWAVSKERKFWRGHAAEWAKFTRVPHFTEPVQIFIRQHCTGRLPDATANIHAVKGAIDGLVDVGVLKDDSPRHVVAITFSAPIKADNDLLAIEIKKVYVPQ